jgi:hypothetical protein
MKYYVLLFTISICMFCATRCGAQQPKPSGDEAAIRVRARAYVDALRGADGKLIATFWTAKGIYIDSQQRSHNAQKLALELPAVDEDLSTTDDSTSLATENSSSIRFITSTVALEQGNTHGGPAVSGSTDDGEANAVHFLALWVKSRDQWQLDFLREIAEKPSHEAISLDQLSWMIGEWKASNEAIEATLVVHWSPGKRYLLQTYRVKQAGQPDSTGIQRIGVNPTDNTLRSWTFGDEGRFVAGRWSREGDAWIVKTTGTLPDGIKVNTVQFWVPDNNDRCWFKSVRPMIDGKETQELALEFIRASPK